MTDYWSRSGGSGQPDFEIALDDGGAWGGPAPMPVHDNGDDGDGDGDGRPRRNWGAIVGIAALAAIALVIAASVVFETGDGGGSDADSASTTMQLEQPAAVPTAPPPTLGAGDLGEFDTPETRYPPMVSAPTPNQQQIPGFPMVPGSEDQDLSAYDLEAAVTNNMPAADPQRSMFNIVGSNLNGSATTSGSPLPPLRATASSEPSAARSALTIDYGGEKLSLVVDVLHEAVYNQNPEDGGRWNTLDPQEVLEGTGAESLGSLFDAFVAGPITRTALDHATVTPSEGLMRIMGGGFARRFDLEIPIEYLRPYGALLFADIHDGSVDATEAPDAITFQVYVTDQAHIALVTSSFDVGPRHFVLSQFFDRRPANVRILLPAISASADATPPASTMPTMSTMPMMPTMPTPTPISAP
jgi:hypothetical protein